MSISLIFSVINALLKFPSELAALIRLLEKTPQEKRQEIIKTVEAESNALDRGERPKWDET